MLGRIGRYELVRLIARGGMASVYEATDPALGRRVALKVIRDADPALVERLRREAAAVARLRHPHIVQVHEVGTDLDVHFIAMDYIDGPTLGDAARGLPRGERVRIMESIARAAAHAHEHGIVHRDIKPGNILVEKGHPYLTDFGLAKVQEGLDLTRSGTPVGTPFYMPPEQVRGERAAGPASDVWSLGAILHELLADRPPFPGTNVNVIYQKILFADPDPMPPGVPRDLETICARALEKSPAHRYATAAEFADDLRRWRDGEPVLARRAPAWERVLRKLRRHAAAAAAVMIVLAVSAAAVLAIVAQRAASRKRLEEADRRAAQERETAARRQAALQRLAQIWSTVVERKRDLRLLKSKPEAARAELAQAVREIDAHVREWPGDPQGWYVRARGRAYLGDTTGAAQDAREAAKRPDFRLAWTLLGLVKVEEHQRAAMADSIGARPILDEALDAFDRGVAPGEARAAAEAFGLTWTREDVVLERLAAALRTAYREEDSGTARRMLEEAAREYRAEEYAWWIGFLGGSLEERIGWWTKAIEWAPGFEEAYYARAHLRSVVGQTQDALADYTRVIELNPSIAPAWVNRGLLKRRQGDDYGALGDYERALAVDPRCVEAYNNRANVRADMGDTAGALADIDEAVRLKPDYPEAWHVRGVIKSRADRLDDALADLTRAIELRPDYAKALFNRGSVRFLKGDFAGAVADYEASLRLTPHDAPWRTDYEDHLRRAREKRK